MTIQSRVFLIIGFLSGLFFLFATPPFRFPDEVGHYLRAAYVADQLFNEQTGAREFVRLPRAIADDVDHFGSRVGDVARGRPFDLNEIISRIQVLKSQEVDLVDQPTVAGMMVYHGVGYFPQAVGFEAARALGGSFVLTLWAARLGALIASILITVIALELMPSWARWVGVAVNLIPMAAYLRGSSAPDAVVTAMTLLGIAVLFDGARRNDIAWLSAAIALAVCIFLAAVKPPYACILLLGLLWIPPSYRSPSHRRIVVAILAAIFFTTLAVAVWHSNDVAAIAARLRPDVLPAEIATADKFQMLLTDPFAVAAIFAKTLLAVPGMAYSIIARFGWSDINPSPLLHVLVIAWGVGVVYLDRRALSENISLKFGSVMLATFAAQVILVTFSIWLFWTETKAPMVQSVQGRHFLPILICGVLGFAAFTLRPFAAGIAAERSVSVPLLPCFVTVGAIFLLIFSLIFSVLGEFFSIQTFHVICLHDLCKQN